MRNKTQHESAGSIRVVSALTPKYSQERQFPRFLVDLKVEVHRAGESRPRLGHSSDLSEGGLGGIMVADLAVGEEVVLVFSGAPMLRAVRVHAKVRERVGYRYGFEFISLSREQRAIIHAASLFLPRAA